MLYNGFLALSILCLTGVVLSQPCSYTHEKTKSSFDLRPLAMGANSYYSVKDVYDTEERNYTYVFNICNNANIPSESCGPTDAGDGPAPAFQVYDDGRCWRLGNSWQNVKYALLDEDDPTQGVSLTYKKGDVCHLDKDIDREMTIKMKCSESWGMIPDSTVLEETCHYELMFETVYGCPLECPMVNRKLCGGNGFCGMDQDDNSPRCFCNEGHAGLDCTTDIVQVSACGKACGLLVFVVILLIGLLLAGGVIFYRVQKLVNLKERFGGMTDKLNVGGDEPESEALTNFSG